jgi:hypothetical protein
VSISDVIDNVAETKNLEMKFLKINRNILVSHPFDLAEFDVMCPEFSRCFGMVSTILEWTCVVVDAFFMGEVASDIFALGVKVSLIAWLSIHG